MVQKVAEFEAGFHHATTRNSLCESSSKWVPFFESGKDKAAKEER